MQISEAKEGKEDKVRQGSQSRNYLSCIKMHSLTIAAFLSLLLLYPANLRSKAAVSKGKDPSYAVIKFDISETAQPSIVAADSKGGKVIKLDGLNQGGRPGEPMLPYSLFRVLVPPDADLAAVQAQLSFADWEELPGEYDIAAVPPAATSDRVYWGGKDISLIIDGKDSSIYGKNAYFPEKRIEVASVGEFRQWKLVEVRVWRAVYNPIQKKVCVLGSAEGTVSVERTQNAVKSVPSTAAIRQKILSEVVNPQDNETFYESQNEATNPAADYVIITTSTIQSNSTKLAVFATVKQMCGYTVKVVTEGTSADDTHYVSGSTTNERANNIRDWLQSHYMTDGIEHVLLIGHPHPTSFTSSISIPMKMCRPMASGGEDTPTDMFYAELSHTWDYDGDGYYGEYSGDYRSGGADKYCEVEVGRIPFYSSYTDLDSILQKTINHCTEGGSLDWRNNVLIAAAISNFGPQDNSPYGSIDITIRVFGNEWGEAIKSLATSYSLSPYTLYEKSGVYSNGSAYPLTSCNASLTAANIIAEWQNHYGFVCWWGHGNSTGTYRRVWLIDNYTSPADNITQYPAETTDTSFFTSSNCSSLDNNYPSYVVEVSCTNAYPESSSNLAYSLLKRGAVGTFAGTRITWYAIATWSPSLGTSCGDNASYGYYIFKRMAEYDDTSAAALNWCKSNFGTGFGDATWMNMLDFNLYGDPANYLMITCGELPPIAYDDYVSAQQGAAKTITLQATDDGLPDPPGVLTYIITSLPSHGRLDDPATGVIKSVPHIVADNGNQVIYTPCFIYIGSDSFDFKANDGGTPPEGGDSVTTATITIDVQPQAPAVIYETNFNGGLPDGWSIIDGGTSSDTWTDTNPGGRSSSYWTGTFMIVDSDYAGTVNMDEQLITHSIDCSDLMDVTLKFKHYFYRYENEVADVDIRVGGGDWQNKVRYQGTSASGQVELDLSSIADGEPDVQIRWHYYNANYEWYWGIDDVQLIATTLLQPTPGDFEQDCDVDFYDFSIFASAWLSGPGDDNWDPDCDISKPADNFIDFFDYAVFANNWLTGL
jgi:hypothetical protein